MSSKLPDVKIFYDKDKNLKEEDVRMLMEWTNKRQHLPKINELQAILFLHSCYYKNEAAKTTVDNFFTLKTHWKEMFGNRTLRSVSVQMDLCLMTVLPKKTPEGHNIFLARLLNSDPANYNFATKVKMADMAAMLHLHQEGPSEGFCGILDFKGATLTHVLKVGPINAKKIMYYLQEALPLRLKRIHIYNLVPFMDKILALVKPFMKKEIADMLIFHESLESLTRFIPLDCLPEDYGGSIKPISVLREDIKKKFMENGDFFEWEDALVVDESKRDGKFENSDVFGADGTFKKLQID